jgi:tRNA dimethylallyltransferase
MPLIGKPLVVILGATAVGKTRLSIPLCQALNGEIISADSRQIYRNMDIGTAKATPAQQELVLHHMIDVVNPDETLTLAQYQDSAYAHVERIQEAGKVPFLVGGTGQYITALVEGWSIPRVAPNWALRDELQAYADKEGVHALHERLQALDPMYAEKTHPNNVRRVIRALEVCIETESTMTEQQRKKPRPYRIYTLGLTMARERLYERADARVDTMIEDGLVKEVRGLLNQGYGRDLPAMSGLGYVEVAEHLLDGVPLDNAIQSIKSHTHDFIRRQDVWFRGHDHGILWHNTETVDIGDVRDKLKDWLEKGDN